MEAPEQHKSRVVIIDSLQSWEFYLTQASNQDCPVVVHFTASWCMPSVAMNPFFEELASSYPDVLFLTVDVDEVKESPKVTEIYINRLRENKSARHYMLTQNFKEVATKMDVKAMPTFLALKDGAAVEKVVGANPEEIKKRMDGFVRSIRVSVA